MLYPADPEYSGDGTHFIFHYWKVEIFSLPFDHSEEVSLYSLEYQKWATINLEEEAKIQDVIFSSSICC
jgi:hypothetical protein